MSPYSLHFNSCYPSPVHIEENGSVIRRGLLKVSSYFIIGLFVTNSLSFSQVSIKERIGITPYDTRGHSSMLDVGKVWLTDTSGQITINGGSGSATGSGCDISQVILLEPMYAVLCRDYTQGPVNYGLPGNWRAGTRISMILVTYPESQHTVYSVDSVYDRYPGIPTHYREFHWSGFEGGAWNASATVLIGPAFDHFLVQFSPDTIAYGDTAQVIVTAVDYGNQEVSFDDTTQLTFTFDGTQFGSFLSPAGVLQGSPLSNITYGDAHAGNVRFVASRNLQDSLASAEIHVSRSSDPNMAGVGHVLIRDPFALELVFPPSGQTIDSLISQTPTMPQLYGKARVTGREDAAVTYHWKFSLRWDYHTRDTTHLDTLRNVFADSISNSYADSCRWAVRWGTLTRGAGSTH